MNDAGRQHGVQYRCVLVPIDGSERSAIALRSGRSLAARLGATLHTVGVARESGGLDALRAAAALALELPPDDLRIHAVVGDDPATAIAVLADQLGSCIICMSTHARGRFSGSVLGSTARELLRRDDRPVLLVGPIADRPAFMGDAWTAALEIGRVVVCVDAERSDAEVATPGVSAAVVGLAAQWALALGMSLTIVHVAPPFFPLSDGVVPEESQRWLAHLARTVAVPGLVVDTHLESDPIGVVDGIRTHLHAHPAGLVVVAAHARTGVDRVLHGATAAGITAASNVATLVLPLRTTGAHP